MRVEVGFQLLLQCLMRFEVFIWVKVMLMLDTWLDGMI